MDILSDFLPIVGLLSGAIIVLILTVFYFVKNDKQEQAD